MDADPPRPRPHRHRRDGPRICRGFDSRRLRHHPRSLHRLHLQQVPSTILILGAWAFGGLIALAGAFIYAELSSQSSVSGGQYVYLRDAFHPALAFVYGWALLLVTQSGGMAAVAVTFAKYVCALGHTQTSDNFAAFLAAIALAVLTIINCFGVRAGSTTQNLFMILKLLALAALVLFGLSFGGPPETAIATPTAVAS